MGTYQTGWTGWGQFHSRRRGQNGLAAQQQCGVWKENLQNEQSPDPHPSTPRKQQTGTGKLGQGLGWGCKGGLEQHQGAGPSVWGD